MPPDLSISPGAEANMAGCVRALLRAGSPAGGGGVGAFTLVELLVGSAIMILVVVMLSIMVDRVSATWREADQRVSGFQSARFAFERITRSLSQATLNPYWDYVDSAGTRRTRENAATFTPAGYGRMSDQAFCIAPAREFTDDGVTLALFFQAPIGHVKTATLSRLDHLLNTVGFFVEFNNDSDAATRSLKPAFVGGGRWRYRLMEMVQPSEDLDVFVQGDRGWITGGMADRAARPARPVAENVIALVLEAQTEDGLPLPSAATYAYDTRDAASPVTHNQLPPQVQVTLVTIDEHSAARLAGQYGDEPPPLIAPSSFQDPARFADDLRDLEAALAGHPAKLNYRVFSVTVRLEAAKWSE